MSEWIDVNCELPEEGALVLVKGEPYGNKGVLIAPAVYNQVCGWAGPGTLFGWIDPSDEVKPDSMDELEGVTHWKALQYQPED